MRKVVILGGGIAGMSAAHELIERGFEVEVYERNVHYVGGKARSVNVPGTNLINPDLYLPGEHGFRFFPGFYKHITDTMKRIPFRNAQGQWNKRGCYDNLVSTTRILLARYDAPPISTLSNFPHTWKDWSLAFRTMIHGVNSGLTKAEIWFFLKKLWQLMSSSISRRAGEYEQIGWWEYLEADRFSEAYRHLLVEGLTRTLVASRAQTASTKTGGNIFLQLMFTMFKPLAKTDRVLNGPTNEQFLHPWLGYLKSKGVRYHLNHEVRDLQMSNGKISAATVIGPDGPIQVTGDYFILAVPIERAAPLITPEMLSVDRSLNLIGVLAKSVSWMNGLQYYLNEDVQISHGHVIYSDSEWAITSISQIQFWQGYDLSQRFNGKVKGILSVDISDWLWTTYVPGSAGKGSGPAPSAQGVLAEHCSPEEVKEFVWEQIKASLNTEGKEILRDDMIEHWYLDRDIEFRIAQGHKQNTDTEPLLVNTVDSWRLRPNANTMISNFFLAADYVRTNTDLATMEGANEAARRAVNGILADCGSKAALCAIWPLQEPILCLPLKWWDRIRFQHGKPYSLKQPLWMVLFMIIWMLFFAVYSIINWLLSLFLWRRF